MASSDALGVVGGGVSERPKELVLKTSVQLAAPWVRIPPPPPTTSGFGRFRGFYAALAKAAAFCADGFARDADPPE